jgi:DNA polymerase-3 subunit alpha
MNIHPLLGVRTDLSLGESIISTDQLKDALAKAGDPQVIGICDTMSITAMIDATKTLTKLGKTLLMGVRIRVIDAATDATGAKIKETDERFIKLFPVSQEGVRSIYRLLTRGFTDERFYYHARVTWDDLIELVTDDSVALATGDTESVLQSDGGVAGLVRLVSAKRFAARFYELVPCTTPYFTRQNRRAIKVGAALGFEPLVSMPAKWLEDGQSHSYSIIASIAERRPYADYLRPVSKFQPHTVAEFAQAAVAAAAAIESRYSETVKADFLKGLENTDRLVQLCAGATWSKQDPDLPKLADDPDAELVKQCKQGWVSRFSAPVLCHQPTQQELASKYLPRLQFELDTLKRLGFANYFLLVQDLVQWSKRNGIYVGPGRGSVGGSLVAYLMGITDVDPIRFDLLFERFINPDRLDLPDADLDFMSTRRQEVIDYLEKRWGADKVAGIVNYNTLGARSALKDVAKIFGHAGDSLKITAHVGDTYGVAAGLEEAREQSPELDQFAKDNPAVWRHATTLEGKMRAYGTHAAGIVVAGNPIVERAVIERRGGARVINWDKRTSEEQGLIKLDVLGLSTLDMFDQAIKLIFARHSVKLDINSIPLDDAKTLDIFTAAKTAGVFQFEGGSVRRLLKEMAKSHPLTFEDLVALNALNRPGPLDAGLTESYVKRRAGQEAVTYPHPSLTEILEPTFGVIAYQEQVMQVSRVLCGYTPGEADMLRKIMGKKLPEEMKKQKDKFVSGAVTLSGMPQADAEKLFNDIEGFAGYAFNRSHAVEYTLISYQAAYIKAHYLVEFYAASMGIASTTLPTIVKQAAADGITVLPPDINNSTHQFEPLNDTIISAPLLAVKGVSEKGCFAIMEARTNPNPVITEESNGLRGKARQIIKKQWGPGPFQSIEDFGARVPAKACNSRATDNLNRVGAFARVEPGQLPSTDPSRQRDQIELMPDLTNQGVVADREIRVCDVAWEKITDIFEEMFNAFPDQKVVDPWIGKAPRLMCVLDHPFNDYQTLKEQHSYREFVQPALNKAGLMADDLVVSFCARRPKRKNEKEVPAEERAATLPYLMKEIEVLKPPVIVLLGNASIKAFFPDAKKPSEMIGHTAFSAALDATVICGFNPTRLYHNPEMIEQLTKVFQAAADLVTA